MKKRIVLYSSLLLILFMLLSVNLKAIGVRPLIINLEMERGATKEFTLELLPEEAQKTVKFNLYYPQQQISGSLSFKEGNLQKHAFLNWFDIPKEIIIPPQEIKDIKVKISAPYDSYGSHTGIIMIEPKIDEPPNGLAFKVRYAVRVNINIKSPGLKKDIEVPEFGLEVNKENNIVVFALIQNPSSLNYLSHGEVTIRDQNQRLVQRVPIKSQYAYNSGKKETRIYPGSKVNFYGNVTEVLHPGIYNLRLFLYYADGKQKIVSKQVEVGDEFTQEGQIDHIELTPTFIEESIRAGGATTKVLQIRNRTGKQLKIKVGGQEIKPEYKHSLFKDFEVQMRGQNNFTLEPRRTGRSIVILRSPREIKPGGYYGKVQIGVFDQEDNQLESKTVDIGMLVGEEREYDCNIKGITSHKDQEQQIFSVSLQNTGSAHFTPNARVYLKDDNGEIIHTLRLALPEGKSRILPDMTGHLFTTRNDIKPGNYTAEITVMHEGEEITTAEYPILIAGEKGDKSA